MRSKPSVLFINRVYPPRRGATGRCLHDLAVAFSKSGWDVSVLATGDKSALQYNKNHKIALKTVKTRDNPARITHYLWIWIRLFFAALAMPRHDLVISMTDPPMQVVMGHWISRIKRSRHMHWCHDLYPDLLPVLGVKLSGFWQKRLARWSRRAMKRADRVVVIGRCMAKHLMHSGIPPGKMSVIPNWADPILFSKAPIAEKYKKANRAVQKMIVNGGEPKFRILYAGNVGAAHPFETILHAAEKLRDEHPEVEFLIVGEGRKFAALQQERERRNLGNIRFLPFQPTENLKTLMGSGDIHMVSMHDKAAGMYVPCKVYSALAAHRPVLYVGPESTEIANMITDSGCGHVIRNGDADRMVSVIKDYVGDAQTWLSAREGSVEAAGVFKPGHSMKAWIERAHMVLNPAYRDRL